VTIEREPLIIKEIAADDGNRVVLLDWNGQSQKFCNLQRVSANGAVLWTATPAHPLEGVWTDARFNDGHLEAYNYAGFLDVIDYNTGHILHRTFVK
jgi:hypothetical protein